MPELPEVETMRRGVANAAGSTIIGMHVPKNRCRPITMTPTLASFKKNVFGRKIEMVDRIGKRIIFRLDSGSCIVVEPRMTGLVFLNGPPNETHLRLIVELDGHGRPGAPGQFLFWDQRGLGVVRLVSPDEYVRYYGPNKVGPDALSIGVEELRSRLKTSDRSIKVALLDQRAVAGIGNLYASEMLHMAGIHPAKRCRNITKSGWNELHTAMIAVLQDAISHQGSTLRDGTYRIARDEPGNYQHNHRVYQRAGKACLTCGQTEIVRVVQAQRSTFFCPECQPARGNRTPRAGQANKSH